MCQWYKVFDPNAYEDVADKCRHSKWGCTDCKKHLGDVLVDVPFGAARAPGRPGGRPRPPARTSWPPGPRAQKVARQTLAEIKDATGLGKF